MSMRVGVIVPSFDTTVDAVQRCAAEAEQAGIHGLFAYDHLWPPGEPGRPAIAPFPLLGMLAAATSSVVLGTLVARVGLVPDEVLIGEFRTVHRVSGGRLIAGIGTGDRLSAAENRAYGLVPGSAQVRRRALRAVGSALVQDGIPVWIGAGAGPTNAIAHEIGATINVFGVGAGRVAELGRSGAVSWGGPLVRGAGGTDQLRSLAMAGATWAVLVWPGTVAPIVAAARGAAIPLGS
jgi:alkanesulfonate monooxygenase SsuD/methylene tetrahydromethanopterin reductase-like flavin-dependent oxidoreductase (luciferase family)